MSTARTPAALYLALGIGLASCGGEGDLFTAPTDTRTEVATIEGDFPGCVSAVALDTSRIQLNFEFPPGSKRMSVYRNGTLVFASTNTAVSSFVDAGLDEGRSYSYTCEALVGTKLELGFGVVIMSTLAVNAPLFAGVAQASAASSSSVQVSWLPPSPGSVAADSYKIYGNPGTTVDWTKPPRRTVALGGFSATLVDLGDELTYAWGVRACSVSSVCDANVVQRVVTLPDAGAPRTAGATAIAAQNGSLIVTAPWQESQGAVLRRKVYVRSGATGGTNLADYLLDHTEFVTNLGQPPTTILVSNGILEATQYHVIIVDEDPLGAVNPARAVVSIVTGDLYPPTFAGVSSVSTGSPADTSVTLGFTAVARQNAVENSATGVSQYLVYETSVPYSPSTSPPNPCTLGTLHGGAAVSADAIAPGAATLPVTGLLPRRKYRFCIQARDNAGNTTVTANVVEKTTVDLSAPVFDGIQSLTFSPDTGLVNVVWNPSSSSDAYEYRVKLWRNNADPSLGTGLTVITPKHATNPTGAGYGIAAFPRNDNDRVYALVDACDDAAVALPGGSQNCTASAFATAKSILLPDVTPPPGFTGIKTSADLVSSTEGVMTVKWNTPADWSDYRGFLVFSVNNDFSLNLLRDCACPAGNCAAPGAYTQCDVSGLDPFRTYTFHVRAYDAAGNVTILDPSDANKVAQKRVKDSTPPTFSSGLAIGVKPAYTLTYAPASDTQYPLEPGATISYEIWRKLGSTWATPTTPSLEAGASLRGIVATTTFTDGNLVDSTTYSWVVCAVDGSGNHACDGTIRSKFIDDITPPQITSFTSTKTGGAALKRWNLSWAFTEVKTAPGNVRANLYQKLSGGAPVTFTRNDPAAVKIASAQGVTTFTNLTGPTGEARYVNYLLELLDDDDNSSTAPLSVFSDNRVTATSIRSTFGAPGGGQRVFVQGTGFSSGANNGCSESSRVWLGSPGVGSDECTSVIFVDSTRLVCTTASHSVGPVNVTVTNPDGGSACERGSAGVISDGYTFTTSAPPGTDPAVALCSDPSIWSVNPNNKFANQATATGDDYDHAYVICNPTHLANIGTNVLYASKYFKLGAHIDLTGVLPAQITFSSGTGMFFDGGGFVIVNYGQPSAANTPLFHFTGASFKGEFKNLGMLNANVVAATAAFGGTLFGQFRGDIDHVFATGSVVGTPTITSYYGGLGGYISYSATAGMGSSITNTTSSVNVTVTNANVANVGGLIGYHFGHVDNSSATGNVTVNNPSTVTDYVGGLLGYHTFSDAMGDNCPTSRCGIDHSFATGNVSGSLTVGGLVGKSISIAQTQVSAEMFIRNSYATGTATGTNAANAFVGGLLGYAGGSGYVFPTIYRCYASGNVSAPNHDSSVGGVGGLVGKIEGQPMGATAATTIVSESFATGNVTAFIGGSSAYYTGGLIGYVTTHGTIPVNPVGPVYIRDSYATGNVTGRSYVGGLISSLNPAGAANNAQVIRSYSTGRVTGVLNLTAFAIAAAQAAQSQDSYFNRELSNIQTDNSGASGKTTAELKQASTFSGWDLNGVWVLPQPEGSDYPKLRWFFGP